MALDDFERFDFTHNGQVRPVERPGPVPALPEEWPIGGDFGLIFLREDRNKKPATETTSRKTQSPR